MNKQKTLYTLPNTELWKNKYFHSKFDDKSSRAALTGFIRHYIEDLIHWNNAGKRHFYNIECKRGNKIVLILR